MKILIAILSIIVFYVSSFAQVIYTLTMMSSPVGTGNTIPSTGDHVCVEDSIVDVTAISVVGYRFINWTGDVDDVNESITTVTMNGNKTVTANFIFDWKTNILVRGNLESGTDLTAFRSAVETAIEANVDNAEYIFGIQTIVTVDTTYHQVKLDIRGSVRSGKVLKTFKNQINTFFEGRFGSATVKTRFFSVYRW